MFINGACIRNAVVGVSMGWTCLSGTPIVCVIGYSSVSQSP